MGHITLFIYELKEEDRQLTTDAVTFIEVEDIVCPNIFSRYQYILF